MSKSYARGCGSSFKKVGSAIYKRHYNCSLGRNQKENADYSVTTRPRLSLKLAQFQFAK